MTKKKIKVPKQFIIAMEDKLNIRCDYGDWKDKDKGFLYHRLLEEINELIQSVNNDDGN
jgi:hypothetical protein